jgi:histidinol dehydrogenase
VDILIKNVTDLDPGELEKEVTCGRNAFPEDVERAVREVIGAVERRGDAAVIEYTERFDGVMLAADSLRVGAKEIAGAARGVDAPVKRALEKAVDRVRDFHSRALPQDWEFTDRFGNVLGQKCSPLERVGIYVPGGKAAYPSSLVMTAVPAMAAGVRSLVVLSPPSSFEPPSPLCAALLIVGCTQEVYRIGGVQGIAALALGTQSVRRVEKIVGPGNIHVTMAKKILFGHVDIDMVAGPSEVLIVADGSVDPRMTAADLLAQAEHDERARAICVTISRSHAEEVRRMVLDLARRSTRRGILERSLTDHGVIYVVGGLEAAVRLANAVSPEHLEIQTEEPRAVLPKIRNAGAIFLGPLSAESFGDYVAGPSHVLPTGGTARFFSPLNVLSFVKFSSIVDMSPKGVQELGSHAAALADAEGLHGHGDSIRCRMEGAQTDGDRPSGHRQ